MSTKGRNISLSSYDDIFGGADTDITSSGETVKEISIEDLHPFKNHPFRVQVDEDMNKTVESVKEYGILTPAIVRPAKEGGFEIVSGHRRCKAAELAGLTTLPCIVRDMDDDTAVVFMVDSNLQRENILPSERAWAFRMKLDAMKRQGERTDITSGQVDQKLKGTVSRDKIAEDSGISSKNVQRFIRLTYLLPPLLEMVDDRRLAFNPAVELSFLKPDQQKDVLEAIDYAQCPPTLSQAQRIKKLAQTDEYSLEKVEDIMNEEKKPTLDHVTIKQDVLKKYFPKNYTPKQMEDTIVKLLEQWQKKRNRNMSL